jgi:hypothetical protein
VEVLRVGVEKAPHNLDCDLAVYLMVALIDFRHTPAGHEFIDMDLSERFTSPVCHAGDYNLERFRAVYNP